ncbi:hypothetical protein, partial [Avibacterium paragallinarum]|uniref:hypothetical protein n=1 Tax=Avibacterium paragallinarum TaxID=728 RepID=UPI00300EB72A
VIVKRNNLSLNGVQRLKKPLAGMSKRFIAQTVSLSRLAVLAASRFNVEPVNGEACLGFLNLKVSLNLCRKVIFLLPCCLCVVVVVFI